MSEQKAAKTLAGKNGARKVVVSRVMWSIIAMAYAAMVAYVAIALGRYDSAMVTLFDRIIFYLTAGATVAGLLLTIRQSITASRQLEINTLLASKQLIANALHGITTDKGMLELVDGIERKTIEIMAYDPKTVAVLNRLLSHFAVIANAHKHNLISDDDLYILHDLFRVMGNKAVRDHVEYNLGEMKNTFPKIDEHPYKVLMDMVDRFLGDDHAAKPR